MSSFSSSSSRMCMNASLDQHKRRTGKWLINVFTLVVYFIHVCKHFMGCSSWNGGQFVLTVMQSIEIISDFRWCGRGGLYIHTKCSTESSFQFISLFAFSLFGFLKGQWKRRWGKIFGRQWEHVHDRKMQFLFESYNIWKFFQEWHRTARGPLHQTQQTYYSLAQKFHLTLVLKTLLSVDIRRLM